jgi:hypothetical protein
VCTEKRDESRSWSYLSDLRAAKPGGIWEPEFTVGRDGALILFFSDETDQAAHSQTIKKVRTYDGLYWRDMCAVIDFPCPFARSPGEFALCVHQ